MDEDRAIGVGGLWILMVTAIGGALWIVGVGVAVAIWRILR